jgi:hypothetical protein
MSISVTNLSKNYGAQKAVNNISFTINNAIGYFYSRNLWNINCTTSSNTTYNTPTDLPTSPDQDVYESGKTIVIVGLQIAQNLLPL